MESNPLCPALPASARARRPLQTYELPAGCRFLWKPYCAEAAVKHAHEMTAYSGQTAAIGVTTLASTAFEKVV
jgi:hypothetical protein